MDQAIFNAEAQHLKDTLAVVQSQWEAATADNQKHATLIRDIQKDRMDASGVEDGGAYNAQSFLDLAELSQYTLALTLASQAQDDSAGTIKALSRMRDKPYFARIDFQFEDGTVKPIYIGLSTLMEKDFTQVHVYDWRVPIASVFYQYGVGSARYEAPAGVIEGEVLLKRQYEIRRGELIYYFDSDEQVQDAFLRELLARPAAEAMKSIVETIQRDQDQIIRDLTTGLLMVQGFAGSGKTSVALHRVAYLMYQGLQHNRLDSNAILILAPNAMFERYIAQVLPDLGEKQVQTMLFEELLASLLSGAMVQPRSEWVEQWLGADDPTERADMACARRHKGSHAFMALLERLIDELPSRWIPFADIFYDGQCVAEREQMCTALCNSKKQTPLAVQLHTLERRIWARIHELYPARYQKLFDYAQSLPQHATETQAFARMLSIRESGVLLEAIRGFTVLDCQSLYRALLDDQAAFARLAQGLIPDEDIEPLRRFTRRGLENAALPYDDACAIAYLQARLYGYRTYAPIRQLVVDEAQDLDALHATLLNMLFPNARFTVLGDIHQTLSGALNPGLYDQLQTVIRRENSRLVTLDKSFRCTREIWACSTQFLPDGHGGACFARSGEAPGLYRAADETALDAQLLEQADACRQAGCQSVAIICKTQADANARYARLKAHCDDITLIETEKTGRRTGLVVVSLYMAKGLEFDAVLVCDVDARHYGAGDSLLLYVACTRALHRLMLFYTGEKSPLLLNETEVRP